ncbi:hypothetical protein DPEC_G00050520 [Dallia pectoralis]|uniref:Uncharacterized protein n=1 Tax=Dallia pectoralis TaxID=75939 RepID=A0ACC2HB78_DALPE|nr:hypothetical protein DPEC_G00050520 [Dallia pectoralis]
MESELNCSSHCDSRLCLIHPGVNTQEGLEILQRLCTLVTMEAKLPRWSVSPALRAVVWTLLSCGILLAFCFLLFTLRFKNNRIVKMSSPNLNVLTLCGSVLAYCSGFLFAVDERIYLQGVGQRAILQARIWTLCIGSTLVFGPILGKTWRLYRVFTQRVPDKRVIIRDIQLMGLVALLVLVDLLVLTAWSLTDPVKCARSIGAVVTVMDRDVSYSLTQLDSCSSVYSDLWVILLAVIKGNLLLYGTYLAGLTSNVSLPPVNQSPTIMTAVSLITLSMAVALPVSWFLPAWPNVVYGVVAGAIFICTLSTNCMLFVPQLTQWRHFEEEHNNPSQMAKYFSSPSKSVHSVYSQDEIYYLLGENTSMKRLINEKNAVIDSLQEQVKNAKDKLLRLMTNSHPQEDQELDSSTTNLQSSSTQTTEVHSDCPPTPQSQRDSTEPTLSSSTSCLLTLSAPPTLSTLGTPPYGSISAPHSTPPALCLSPGEGVSVRSWSAEFGPDIQGTENEVGGCQVEGTGSQQWCGGEGFNALVSPQPPRKGFRTPGEEAGTPTTPLCPSNYVSSFSHPSLMDLVSAESGPSGSPSNHTALWTTVARQPGFVSSAELQEILQELSVDAVMETALRSPNHTGRTKRPSQASSAEPLVVSPLSLRSPRSPNPPFHFRYPNTELPSWGKGRDTGPAQPDKNPTRQDTPTLVKPEPTPTSPLRPDDRGVAGEPRQTKKQVTHRCRSRGTRRECRPAPPDKCSFSGRVSSPHGEGGGEGGQARDCGRDSDSYWDSDSSSSADYCHYHHPYCDTCRQHGSYPSSDSSSSDSSDSEYGGFISLCRSTHPQVNFKEDLKPTFV